jgi:hypothetical protein
MPGRRSAAGRCSAISTLLPDAGVEKVYHLVHEIDPSPDLEPALMFGTPDAAIDRLEAEYELGRHLTAAPRLDEAPSHAA